MRALMVVLLMWVGVCGAWAQAALTILPMGDSNTREAGACISYTAPLFDTLQQEGWSVASLGFSKRQLSQPSPKSPECQWHNGVGNQRMMTGYTGGSKMSGGYLQSVENYLEAAGYPDILLLMVGTNDVLADEYTSADDLFHQWQTLLARIVALRPQTQVIVSTVPTMAQRWGTAARLERIAALNAKIKALFDITDGAVTVAGKSIPGVLGRLKPGHPFGAQAKVALASMTDVITPEHLRDGVHMTLEGATRIATVWQSAIERVATPEGGLKAPLAPVAAYTPEGDRAKVTVVFNHSIKKERVTLTVGGAQAHNLTLSEDGRRLTGTLTKPLKMGSEAKVVVNVPQSGRGALTLKTTVKAVGRGVEENIDPRARKGFRRVRGSKQGLPQADLKNKAEAMACFTEVFKGDATKVEKVAYYFELARPGEPLRYVWVEADGNDLLAVFDGRDGKVQRALEGVRVISNAVASTQGADERGFITYTVGAYRPERQVPAMDPSGIPNFGRTAWYDWDDTFAEVTTSGGALQLYRRQEASKTQLPMALLFAYNRWAEPGTDDVLIGDFTTHRPNRGGLTTANGYYLSTYAEAEAAPKFAIDGYTIRHLEIWAK